MDCGDISFSRSTSIQTLSKVNNTQEIFLHLFHVCNLLIVLVVSIRHHEITIEQWAFTEHLPRLREISEVKGIVRLGRCGQQFSHDSGIDGVSGIDQLRDQLPCIFKTSQPGRNNG